MIVIFNWLSDNSYTSISLGWFSEDLFYFFVWAILPFFFLFYNFMLESTHMKTPPFPNLYGLVLYRKGLSQMSLPRDFRGASDIFWWGACMCDFPGLVCAISQRALLAPPGACLWHCKFSGATATKLPCPLALTCHQPSRVYGLISTPCQMRQIPFLCVVPWKVSGAPESLSTLFPLSQRRETLRYVCAFSQSCQVMWAIGCHSSLSLVSASFRHSYYASSYHAASEAQQKPSLRQPSMELECWMHCALSPS